LDDELLEWRLLLPGACAERATLYEIITRSKALKEENSLMPIFSLDTCTGKLTEPVIAWWRYFVGGDSDLMASVGLNRTT
jgi:hypothetical protein